MNLALSRSHSNFAQLFDYFFLPTFFCFFFFPFLCCAAETFMNQASSRSHSIFILTLEQTNSTDGSKKVLQRVAACCSVLQCVAACCSVLQCVAVCCRFSYSNRPIVRTALRRVCCSVLQCVAVCCRVLQCIAVCCYECVAVCCSVLQCVAVCCIVLQCAAVCCSVLQCVAVCCSVLRCALAYHNCNVAVAHNPAFGVKVCCSML